ncbi:MAG: nicotinate-nucleotide--dimethylbenzimidazole phosphoribosyltransferase [Clostridiales bacterium]|nr:nicotinate-nucleotide--dimethylbenzimidazole phosphoribosyltransferase [Clostridiales bacterium]
MECFEKLIWNNRTKESLTHLNIDKLDEISYKKVLKNWDNIAKPVDGLGRFETLIAQIGAIQRTDCVNISKKAVIIMCADNGIVEEGISQSGQDVTMAVVQEMAKNQSSVGKMAQMIGADTIPVDIGINSKHVIKGVVNKKIRCGTRNFKNEPAMTEKETIQAILTGIEIVSDCKKEGYHILATGEMGIGNTTTSSAVAAALLNCSVEEVTGRGAGLDDKKLVHKKQVITQAIEKYKLREADALQILSTVGGLDIAGLAGVCIGGALFHIPIVLDGVISMVSALLAERIMPGTKAYMIPSHKGKEPAIEKLMAELNIKPVIDGNMALGEGTGAVMMLSLLEIALSVYQDRTTFSDMKIEQYKRQTTYGELQ